ncbi:AAA family ATPase [Myxococcota bacterium]|nr:AAA family ATPase [Myxococcota bacterium]
MRHPRAGELARYAASTVIAEEPLRGLYRGVRLSDGAPVVLERLSRGAPAIEVDRLRRAHTVARRAESAHVLRPIDLMLGADEPHLVFEGFDAQLLATELGRPMELGRFLELAAELAAALSDLHRSGFVHNDVSPACFLVHRSVVSVRLIGLGHATPLRPTPIAAGCAIGGDDPVYMAPERTGRMNRTVDHRSDLYSLGVVYYEMLTGALPFHAHDAGGWVHCHLAQTPRPPVAPSRIPDVVSAIVLRLLAKQADDRYQTADGLRADLLRCAADWRAHRDIATFPLGSRDVPDYLLAPERLYGRQRELSELQDAFDRVAAGGRAELVLVAGPAGIGKTALVNELRKALLPRGAIIAAGKCDDDKHDIPYATLAQALQTLVRHALSERDADIARWRRALRDAVGPNGGVVAALVPDLGLLIGEQPPVPEVPSQDAQNRFNITFRQLFDAFARPEHPLVLFLDDLQWIDDATLRLLEHVLTHPGVRHLLVLGGYRDNDVGRPRVMPAAVAALRDAGAETSLLSLGPLTSDDVRRFTADALRCSEDHARSLAELVSTKTGGNPFFVGQFLAALVDARLVAFDHGTGAWRWDLETIRTRGFTDNVADLMVQKLTQLPAATQEALQRLACLGTRARLSTLAAVCGSAEEQIERALVEAVQAGLVLRSDDNVVFLHDRVREAAYTLIPEVERTRAHLIVGRRLLSHADATGLEDALFDIVHQLNRGADLMTDPSERARVSALDVQAGRRARATSAFATARGLFDAAAALLPDDAWEVSYTSTFEFQLDRAEATYSSGAFDDAERLLDELGARGRSALDLAAVHGLRLSVYLTLGRYEDAITVGSAALRLLEEPIPDGAGLDAAITVERALLDEQLRGRDVATLAALPEATDPKVKAATNVMSALGGAAYIGGRPDLYHFLALKNLNYILRSGATVNACSALSGYAYLQVSTFGAPELGFALSEVALRLGDRFGDAGSLGLALYIHANHVNLWVRPFATGIPILERGFRLSVDVGNLTNANYIAYSLVWQLIERGDALGDALAASRELAKFSLESGNDALYQTIVLEQQFMKCLMGETSEASFSGGGVDESACVARVAARSFTCGITYYHTMKALAAVILGDARATEHVERAQMQVAAVTGQPMEATLCFVRALVALRMPSATEPPGSSLTVARSCRDRLVTWAEHCPENFASRAQLISALVADAEGDALTAQALFERSITTARESGFRHWEAMACEAAAEHHERRGLATIARAYRRDARSAYARWGAAARVKTLERPRSTRDDRPDGPVRSTVSLEQLDLTAIIKAQHAISAESSLDRVADALLRIAIENAGARSGYLSVEGSGHLRAELAPTEDGVTVLRGEVGVESRIPSSIVNYVRRSRRTVVLDDAESQAGDFASDEYLLHKKPRSILCLAIQRRAKLLGVLYLENDLAVGAFTAEHRAIIEALAAQAAISLEAAAAYRALKTSEERLRLTLEAAEIGVFDWDVQNDLWRGSSACYTLLGSEPIEEEVDRTTWLERVHPEDRALVEQKIDELRSRETGSARNQEQLEYDARLRHVDGRHRWHHVKGFSIERDTLGRATRVLGVQTDVSERRAAQEVLARHQEQLEELVRTRTAELESVNRELESFAYSVSHDLRAPLRQIDGFVGLLGSRLRGSLDDKSLHYMDAVSSAAKKAGQLIDDMLAFSRVGRAELLMSRVELDTLVREVIRELAADLRGRNVEWDLAPLPAVIGDRSMLRLVLLNLVSNAIKFTRPRNPARITIGREPGNATEAVIFVRDNGVGFDERYASQLFGVFRRLHREEDFEGTGIGLANVHRIITRHGGRTWAHGELERGATFTFTLPLA